MGYSEHVHMGRAAGGQRTKRKGKKNRPHPDVKLVTCWQRRRKVGHLVGHALDGKLGGGSGQAAGRARRQRHIANSRCGVDFLVVLGSEARRRGSYGAASDVDAGFGGWSRARARAVGQGLVRRAALLLPQLVASKVEQRAVGGACQPRVKLEYKPTVPTYTQFQVTRPNIHRERHRAALDAPVSAASVAQQWRLRACVTQFVRREVV